jgi:hypothetical protein
VTVPEAICQVQRVSFCGLFRDWRFSAHPRLDGGVQFLLDMRVPDRNLDHPVGICQSKGLNREELVALDESGLTAHLHRLVVELAQHEASEAFLFDGRRLFDPHATEAGREGRS